jgi:hypothetical protein
LEIRKSVPISSGAAAAVPLSRAKTTPADMSFAMVFLTATSLGGRFFKIKCADE